ncbi:MAG: translocation/assembly module TamB domain-containing protein [Candidatus Acidiferrales bacterium]
MNARRAIRRVVVAIAAILVVVAIACVAVVHTNAFRNFVRSEIQKEALHRTGARVDIGGIEIDWARLAIELRDVVVRGDASGGAEGAPLLRAKGLEVSVRFLPLLRKRLELGELILDQPVLRLRIDASGNSNLPVPPHSSPHNTTAEIFDLEVRNCAIRSGQIYYNDAETSLDAELHNLDFRAGYSRLTGKYTGSLSYESGRISTTKIQPIENTLRVQFAADRAGLSLDPLVLSTRASRVTLTARLTNYANPEVSGTYAGNLLTNEVAAALRTVSLPLGNVSLDGSFRYRSGVGHSFLAALDIEGRLRSAKLALRTGERPLDFTAVSATYQLEDANLRVRDLSADVLGGRARGNWEMLHVDASDAASRVDASLQGISLTRASDTLAPRDVQRIPLAGVAAVQTQASWAGSLDNLVARVRLVVASPRALDRLHGMIPVSGVVQVDYEGPRNMISFGQSYLQTTSTKLNIAGTLSSRRSGNSHVSVLVTTTDLHEVSEFATIVENALSRGLSHPLPSLAGSASLHAAIAGTAKNPVIRGQLAARDFEVDGSRWKALAVNLSAQPSEVSLQNGTLLANPRGEITFAGSAGLHDWALLTNSRVSFHATVANISIADAERVAGQHYPVTGILSATVSVAGTKANPEVKGTATLTHASAWNEAIDNLTINANSANGTIRSVLTLRAPAGAISGSGDYQPATERYQLSLHGSGVQLAKIPMLQHEAAVQGAIDFSASGSGTIRNPSLQANLAASQIQVRDQTISNMSAQVALASHRANLTLHSTVDEGSVDAKADVDLQGVRYTTASVDVRALPLAPVLTTFFPSEGSSVSGQTELHLTLQGPLENPEQMQGHLEIPTFDIAYGKAQLALAEPLHADYRNGVVTVAPAKIQGTGTNLTFSGAIPIRSASPYAISAHGSMDLSILRQFAPNVQSSGQVLIHVSGRGNSFESGMRGELQVKDAVFFSASVPIGIEGLNAQINLSGDRADIAKFSGTAGGGTVSATGFFIYGHDPNFNVALNAKSVRVRYPQGLRSVLSGRLNLQGAPSNSQLTGRVSVDRLSFTQAFDLSDFAASFSEESGGGPPSSFERGMKLDVAVRSAQELSLASSKLSMGGSANLMVTGTLTEPVVLGRIALTNGEVFFLSKRFEVQSGTIVFANPVRTSPVVNLHVTTTIEQYDITLNLSGPVDRLKTNYTSSPPLAPADIIHLLAFGNTTEEAGLAPSSSVATSAESVLAQGVSGQVAGKIENLTGISQLTIDPLAANTSGDPGAQIAIQERVTGSLLLTFSTNVASTESQTVEVQYRLNKQLSVTVLRDQNGGYGIDLRLHKSF